MRLNPSPLFNIASRDKFEFDNKAIDELYGLIYSINSHPFKNLVAVIYYNLKKNNYLKRLPLDLIKQLKDSYYNALILDMYQRRWLEDFIKRLLPTDVQIILLKGSANWGTIYSPRAPRIGCDIDILVKERDFEKIVGIMSNIAIKQIIDEKRVYSNYNSYEYSYKLKDMPVGVEIHRRISYPFVGKVDYNDLFKNSQIHPYYRDKRVRIMNPMERLVNTFIHSLKHADITVHEIVDSYRIINKYNLDLKNIIDFATGYGLYHYSILFLNNLFFLLDDKKITGLNFEIKHYRYFKIKRRIFNYLYLSNSKINYRMRQLLSLILMDDISDILHFIKFYTNLRAKDIIYYYFLNGRVGQNI